jgi:DNA topoisomerase-3
VIEIVSIERKGVNMHQLFDLTGLQVYCNTKFGFTADETLKLFKLYMNKK